MTSHKSTDTKMMIEKLLYNLGRQGILYVDLTDEEIEAILVNSPSVSMNDSFQHRARTAMQNAQAKRASTIPSGELGPRIAKARQQVQLDVKEISREIGVAARVLEALEAGELRASQIMHNFPAATMLKLLRKLQIRVDDFGRMLIDTAANAGTFGSFTETQAVYRKHIPDDVELLGEVTEYIAQIEGLDKDQ